MLLFVGVVVLAVVVVVVEEDEVDDEAVDGDEPFVTVVEFEAVVALSLAIIFERVLDDELSTPPLLGCR